MSLIDTTPHKMKTMTNRKFTGQKRDREDLEAVSWFASLVNVGGHTRISEKRVFIKQ